MERPDGVTPLRTPMPHSGRKERQSGFADTTPFSIQTLSSTTSELHPSNLLSSFESSIGTRCQWRSKVVTHLFEQNVYSLPPPSLLTRPMRDRQMRIYSNLLDAFAACCGSIAVDPQSISDVLTMERTLSKNLSTFMSHLNDLATFQLPRSKRPLNVSQTVSKRPCLVDLTIEASEPESNTLTLAIPENPHVSEAGEEDFEYSSESDSDAEDIH